MTSVLVVGFDATVLNMALPAMASQLGAGISQQQWASDACAVVLAAAMPLAALLGDRLGRRRILIAGLAGVFLADSLGGTVAGSPAQVIGARALLGLGSAAVMPPVMAVIPTTFPPQERSKAIGALTAASALGMPLGPIIGAWLLDHLWWGSVFFW